jgi:hypothetical protein
MDVQFRAWPGLDGMATKRGEGGTRRIYSAGREKGPPSPAFTAAMPH